MSAVSTALESQEAWQLALSSDESIMLWELSLDIHTPCVEKKLLLFCLSIERSLGSEEGAGDQQMTPELLNKAFQRKLHTTKTLKTP